LAAIGLESRLERSEKTQGDSSSALESAAAFVLRDPLGDRHRALEPPVLQAAQVYADPFPMAQSSKVITRFAPSPTGFLHIGGARTALFCWLYARHCDGEFRLRIEDTDRARSTPEAIEKILEGLTWLGLNWEGPVIYQSQRFERHRAVAQMLFEQGKAYRCYCTPEELKAMREQARAESRTARYDGRCRRRSDAPDAPFALRFKAPQDGLTIVRDAVQGDVRFANSDLDDMVILRSDGTPTYMLSVVVDDYDMEVTHVVRGDDHLTNAARQMQLIQALGWPLPLYAHVPLIHGPDGTKLSKRHGALGVDAYRDMGYLPEAMRNYLLRLGWSHGNDEIISTEQAIAWFSLEAIGRSPARFDFAKLDNLNGHYIRAADNARLANEVIRLANFDSDSALRLRPQLLSAMPALKDRAKTLMALTEGASFLWKKRPLALDPLAQAMLTESARQMLRALVSRLEETEPWDAAALEAAVRAFAQSKNEKLGGVAQPLRAALTGQTVSPPVFDVLAALGREESLNRLRDQTA
jgi:glutamyl-tRNA synthetase